jgi:hypothetical protein
VPAQPPTALNPGANHPFGPRGPIGTAVVPYLVPYPVYSDGEYYPESSEVRGGLEADAPSPPQGQPIIIVMPPQQALPPESIPQKARETQQAAANDDSASRSNDPFQFFIALKDHSVYSAFACWVQGDMLHYVTSDGSHNLVSLALVDRKITARLNAGARVAFVPPRE